MPLVRTVEEAVDLADRFLRRYYGFLRLQKAVQEDGEWIVEFDVSLLQTQIVRVRVDAETGSIVEYTRL